MMLKRILTAAAVLLAGAAYAQPTPTRIPPKYTVATAPSCVDGEPKLYSVTDAASSASCTVGGGTTEVICQCLDGTASVVGSGSGSASNSFETINAPAGTDPVADSATDTLNITCAGGLTCTGTAGTDTLDLTMGTASAATALAANPADCSANQFANAIAASGDLTCAAIADADVPDNITVTLAGTASALAVNGANCSAGQYPLGVDASGAAESCTADDDTPDSDSEVPDSITVTGSVSPSTFTFPASAAPSQTTDAQAAWDSDDNRLTVGDGASTLVIYPGAHAGAVTDGGAATTATALAANGGNCSAGNYPLGVDASGAVESCTADDDLPDADEVTESMLKAVDAAADEECLTYESTVGDFEWQSCGSGIGGSTGATDNAILRADGTGGATLQNTTVTIDDNGDIFTASGDGIAFGAPSANPVYLNYAAGIGGAGNSLQVRTGGAPTQIQAAQLAAISAGNTTGWYSHDGTGFASGGVLVWSSSATSATSSLDLGLARNAAGVLRVTNGSSGIGKMLAMKLVEANTAGSGTPNAIAANESGTVFTNEGVTAKNYEALPLAVAGYRFTFIVQDADGMRVVANTSDTIRIGATVSSAAGYCESTTIGDSITLVAINAVEWLAISLVGSGWTCAIFFPAFGIRRRLRDLLAANDNAEQERKAA